jgi:NAD(P)-dependent dehydrogenase (short-subunit alcohol dehydrogenase family)
MITAVMTGASSGLGYITLKKLTRESDIRVITGSRMQSPDSLPLDLETIGVHSIDILILNAGTQNCGLTKSADGYEMTFAVNHLAHYLLLRLLLPHLAENARIVMTSSGTYDPAEKTIIPAPKHANAIYLAFPERDPDKDTDSVKASGRAYSSSKLCTMLTVRALNNAATLKGKNIKAFAYDPGPTPAPDWFETINSSSALSGHFWDCPSYGGFFPDQTVNSAQGTHLPI